MTPRESQAFWHYRLPLRRRVRRFFRELWHFITAPRADL